MNGFFKRRLPAFALALILAVGMTPSALADTVYKGSNDKQHTYEIDGTLRTEDHEFEFDRYETEPSCFRPGLAWYTCKVCLYSCEKEAPATGRHTYGTAWESNNTQHWQKCTTPGCKASSEAQPHEANGAGKITPPTCTKEGFVEYTCKVCNSTYTMKTADMIDHKDANLDGKCDACGYAMIVATPYTVTYYTGSSSSTESVAKGAYPKNVPSVPSMPTVPGAHIFKGWVSGAASYYAYKNQSFVSPGSTPVNGNTSYSAVYQLRATGRNASINIGSTAGVLVGSAVRTQVAAKFYDLTGVRSFSTIRFTSTGGSGKIYATSGKKTLDTGSYTYNELADYLYLVPSSAGNFTLNYTAADSYDNQLSGTITFSISGISNTSSDILYRVAPGGTVNFKISDFEKAYANLANDSSSNLRYVAFRPSTGYDNFTGALYTGSRELTRDRLNQYTFYISNDRYGGDYSLDSVNFKAGKNAREGDALAMTFRVYYNSSTYYDGTLHILIDEDGGTDEVVYRVSPGGSVTFNRSDFNRVYQDVANSSRTVRYVEFDPGNDYTTFEGKISALGHAEFERRELAREQFNYTGDSYGDYALDDLIFKATSGAKDGDSLEIPFWAYYNKDDYAEGTLRIIIDKYGSQDTVTCNVAPGGTSHLDKSAFNQVYRALSGYSGRTISAVAFSAPDGYRNFTAKLYVRNTVMEPSDLNYSATWFYYSDARQGDYAMDDLNVQVERNAKEGTSLSIPFRAYYNDNSNSYEEGVLRINITSEANTITYEAAPGGSVNFKAENFNKAYQTQSGYSNRTIRYVAFEANSDYASFAGSICANGTALTRSTLSYNETRFYYDNRNYGDYALSSLSFRADSTAKDKTSVSIPFRAYYSDSDYEAGTLKLVVNSNTSGDITYTVTPGRTVNLDRTKFDEYFRKTYSSYSLSYVVFDVPGSADFPDASGTLYSGYGSSYSKSFSRNGLRDVRFYYNANEAGRDDYAINDLTFAAANSFTTGKVVLRFTAYGSGSRSVEGNLVILPGTAATTTVTSNLVGSIRYATTSGVNVQISANEFSRFYKSVYPSGVLQYVIMDGVPAAGGLYYNYYGASRYGSTAREQITASNRTRNFYLSPATTSEYALSELTYVPSGANYCASIPFTAHGSSGQSTTGSILISVTSKTVSEVYGPTPKGVTVTFPASSIAAAVSAATGTTPSGVQLLKLPATNAGTVYVGTGTSVQANTTTVYGYNTGSQQLGQLRFVPNANYTGPVEIPYAALNSSGAAIASGMFSLGVLNNNKKFTDVTASTWCYKYVVELADAAVIDGYADGSFKPDSTITYGAALKLIMLAAGYSEQAPVKGGGTFSGYLAKAQADGLITRSNVNLSGPITRLQVAQLAAGALKLDINNLSSVKPFTDTADVYVQALNAAGIVEGYYNNGTSTFRPGNTLTRGQVSAIVWRMRNYVR